MNPSRDLCNKAPQDATIATEASKAIARAICVCLIVTAPIHCVLLRIFVMATLANASVQGYTAKRKSADNAQLLPRCRFALRQGLIGIGGRQHQVHNLS